MKLSVLKLLEEKIGSLTPAQKKVADYILKNPTEVAFLTVEQAAGIIGVSVATVMRLAYAMGYSGYAQFQKSLQELLLSRIAPPDRLEVNVKKTGKNNLLVKCAEVQIANIHKTVGFLSDKAISGALDLVFAAKNIYIIGVRGSMSPAIYLNESLNRIGVDCELLMPDTGRLQSIITNLSQEALIIAISLPRYARRTIETVTIAKSKGAKILSITDGYSSPLAILSDIFLPCAFESLSFHHSTIAAMFIADFLITSVAVKDSERTKHNLENIEKVVAEIDANILK